ncbi:MAG: T9SS type A sorting domain-containing protein [Saprospiraceae bacterium]|nr:T9SS type A sorting domain-containing protein [Saprospiraceae bacterium]
MRCKIFTLLFLCFSISLFSQDWVQVSPVPDSFRSHHAFAFGIGDFGYMVAGNVPGGTSSAFFIYDPTMDEWTTLDDYPGPARGYGIGDVYNEKAYLGFGSDNNGDYLNDLWVFDPSDESWTQLSDCPCAPRTHPAFVAQGGFIYVGMGGSDNGNLNDWWAYDITNDSWEELPSFPSLPRHHPYQFAIGDYVYAGFGHGPLPDGGGFISKNWYRYDPATTIWMQVADHPIEGRVAGQQFSYNGKGYVLSGEGEDHRALDTGELWEYDPGADTWTELPPHPGWARWAPASFVVNGEVYIINGVTREPGGGSYFVTDVFKFNLNELVSGQTEPIEGNFTIYPNPATDHLVIEATNGQTIQKLDIFDSQGRHLKTVFGNSIQDNLDISTLPKGMHIIRITGTLGTYQQRVMKL